MADYSMRYVSTAACAMSVLQHTLGENLKEADEEKNEPETSQPPLRFAHRQTQTYTDIHTDTHSEITQHATAGHSVGSSIRYDNSGTEYIVGISTHYDSTSAHAMTVQQHTL
eukprot:2749090-Rhodomonas_salina.1